MNSSPFVVTRAALYEQVWARPMLQLAGEYRITGNGLAKACRKANIPVPPRGYWAKLKHGKRVKPRPPLQPTPENHTEIIIRPSRPAADVDPHRALCRFIATYHVNAVIFWNHGSRSHQIKWLFLSDLGVPIRVSHNKQLLVWLTTSGGCRA